MGGRFFLTAGGPIRPSAGSDIRFVAEDGFDAALFAPVVEFNRAVEISMVRNGDRVHARRFDMLHQLRNAVHAVQKAVVSMTMQMGKRAS